MSFTCQATADTLCGCCTGVTRLTPAVIANRPLLGAISYRVGTYSSFLQTMLAALSGSDVPALAGLRTRDNSDFSIALVDAWSEVLDILTFYTERLANEAYLGTAVEARSVFELVRLIGYTPSPGVSASATLVFTLASSPGAPATVPIPAGTRVQSVPGPGQQPAVFETSTDLTATIAANAIPAATTQSAQLSAGDTSTWVAGTANNISPGDALLFIAAPGGTPTPSLGVAVSFVTSVQTDPSSGNTLLTWDQPLTSVVAGTAANVCLYVFRTKAALFGVAAPFPGIFSSSTTASTIPGYPSDAGNDWSWIYQGSQTINLDAAYPGLKPAATSPAGAPNQLQWVLMTGGGTSAVFQIAAASESNPVAYAMSAKTSQLTMTTTATNLAGSGSTDVDTLLGGFVQSTRDTTVYVQSQLLALAALPITAWSLSGTYQLAGGMLAPVSGKTLLLSGLQPLGPNVPVGVSGKNVRIAPSSASAAFTPAGATAGLPVSANQPFLVTAFPPASDPASGNLLWSVNTVTGQAGTLSVAPGAIQLLPSAAADPIAGEAPTVATAAVEGATTLLTFSNDLGGIYDASTVTVNANAVAASHGETTQEILGSGDAANPALMFQLKQSPLTYTPAPNPAGVQSTLQVRVNNLLWTGLSNFLESAPSDRAYVTLPSSSAGAIVQFGDGVHGSRTPTGQSNVQALYRVGIGLAGMVAAGQLTQALDRPQGLQSVTNPAAATGGADPATPADARMSAPLPTLTIGRAVSLEDYQNYALNIPGISLALATWTWFGSTRGIFLTVAGAGGTTLSTDDQVVQNLQASFQGYGLPHVPVAIVSYVPVLFDIALQVLIDSPTYVPTIVVPQVWQSLVAAFAFGQLAPAQGVAASQIIAIAQQVPGVVAVNLTALNRSGDTPGLANVLCASGPHPTASPPAGAEVLLLDPAAQGNVVVWPS
jgi:hypothetical protein